MIPLPSYDEVHVISDLHMGGSPGFQILKETTRLAGFIRWVGEQCQEGRVALVLNGDVIDTLAEDDNRGYVAIDNAVDILHRIMADTSFAPIWAALAQFVKLQRRTLVIVLGNHDIEMAFPTVQRAILDALAGDDLGARARVEFSTAGAGFSCLVGQSRVFCTHGNEVDAWNFVRYEDLGRAARRINASRPLPPSDWTPNAGTKLVKDVMNDIKRQYAWIDLLKPETGAAVGILAALDPRQLEKLKAVIPIVGKKLIESGQVDQRLSLEGFASQPPDAESAIPANLMLGPNLLRGITPKDAAKRIKADQMLHDAEAHYNDRGLDELQARETLGYGQLIWDRLTGWLTHVSQEEALRRALDDWLRGDVSFEIDLEGDENRRKDELFFPLLESIGPDIHFVVTGHTHLARAMEIGGNRFYFNCGTWIRLLRVTDKMLKNETSFKPVYDVLKKGDMASIDNHEKDNENKRLVLDRTSAVCIRKSGDGRVVGELAHIKGGAVISREIVKQFSRA